MHYFGEAFSWCVVGLDHGISGFLNPYDRKYALGSNTECVPTHGSFLFMRECRGVVRAVISQA